MTGVTLVTGAAGALGSAAVGRLLDKGFHVIGVDRWSIDAAREAGVLVGEHPGCGRDYVHVVADVTEHSTLLALVEEHARAGPLAHVVSIAGGAAPGETQVTDPALVDPLLFRQSVDLNLTSQFLVASACLPWLRCPAGAGTDRSVTLTSSINALVGMDMFGYTAAKAVVLGLVRTLAAQLGPEGIRVNAVSPGTVRTPRTERAWAHDPAHFDRLADTTALGRLTTDQEVAATVVALATELTAVTGQNVVVDAGQTARWHY